MKKLLFLLLPVLSFAQTKVITKNNLIIYHGDITLYLSDDTCSMVSKHILTYDNFLKIGTIKRGNDPWFEDTYKGKYKEKYYKKTGYDLGHYTPFKATSYNLETSNNSFSLFNQGPQFANFNEHPWEQLEMHVLDTIAKYKKDAILITGCIYELNNTKYLPNSKIKIPAYYFKTLLINNISYCWIGDNKTGLIKIIKLDTLNSIFLKNKMNLIIQ